MFVPKTALLETERLLRSTYGRPAAAIVWAFQGVLGLPSVTVEDVPAVHLAIRMLEQRVDFAYALHRTSSEGAERLATFDA